MADVAHLDSYDRRLLTALSHDSSLTNAELAAKVALSSSQCHRRRIRLEQLGVIRGYRADVSGKALGIGVNAFIHVSMAGHSSQQRTTFIDFIRRQNDVQSCHTVTGDADYILRVGVPDLDRLSEFINFMLDSSNLPLVIRSHVVLGTVKDGPVFHGQTHVEA